MMSSNETNLFYLLDWSDKILDIREQYPLIDLVEAIKIAESAQIRYPYDAKSGFPYVMTSDFYIESTNGVVTIAVKPSLELEKPRVREKLEIERRYWRSKGIKWELVTEHEINNAKARNIEWLSQASDLTLFGLSTELQSVCIDHFMSSYILYDTLGGLFKDLEQRFGLNAGCGINIYKHLIYHKEIKVDVSQPIDVATLLDKPAIFSG